MKIAIVISTMNAGGAERIVSLLSNYWVEKTMQVDIFTFDNENNKSFYELNPAVKHHHLGAIRKNYGIIGRFRENIAKIITIRNAIKSIKPDVIISFIDQTNVLTILSSAFLGVPVIVTEHVNTRYYSPGKFWEILRIILYPFASSMVAVSNGVLESFPRYMRRNAIVIPNPINIIKTDKIINRGERKTIIGMGRLTYQKGFDVLIRAFDMIKEKHSDWDLEIYGEGPLRNDLEKIVATLKLQERIKLPGLVKEPAEKFAASDIFVLSSRFEGFGIVIIEAMACGIPVVSFDCPSGPTEIISNEVDGVLVPTGNIESLSKKMDELMSDENKRNLLAKNACESAKKYKVEEIAKHWNGLFTRLIPGINLLGQQNNALQ
ncbi:MAG: glycosyltransferase family 4 protein [Elusimicrobiota bacterium]